MIHRPIPFPHRRRRPNRLRHILLRHQRRIPCPIPQHNPAQQRARKRTPRPMRRTAHNLLPLQPHHLSRRTQQQVIRRTQMPSRHHYIQPRTHRLQSPAQRPPYRLPSHLTAQAAPPPPPDSASPNPPAAAASSAAPITPSASSSSLPELDRSTGSSTTGTRSPSNAKPLQKLHHHLHIRSRRQHSNLDPCRRQIASADIAA